MSKAKILIIQDERRVFADTRKSLEKIGYEVIIFHTSGTGGAARDELVLEKNVAAVVDLSILEVTDYLYNGLFAGTPDRCQAALK